MKMKTQVMMVMAFAMVMMSQSQVALGQTGDGSHGGDICENRIKIIRDDIGSWISLGGSTHLVFPLGVSLVDYNQGMNDQIRSAEINCTEKPVYVGRKEKTCKNFTDATGRGQIECNISRFMDPKVTSESNQYVLIHHEYAGLAGIELGEGDSSEYPLSNQVTGFLENRVVKKLAIVPRFRPLIDPAALNFVSIPLNNYCDVDLPGNEASACFYMGSPRGELGRDKNEDQHMVVLQKTFEMQTTLVTQALWLKVMGSNPSMFCSKEACPKTFQLVPGTNGTLQCLCPFNPVEQVSYYDSKEFIRKLNAKNDGYTYALPTEAQWEYAARAGSNTAYYFGDAPGVNEETLKANAWYEANSEDHTHEVAARAPNAFHLYDMAGNVSQWVNDSYADDYGVTQGCSVSIDPAGPSSDSLWVIRGGSWLNFARSLRSADRRYGYSDYRVSHIGLRLVRFRGQ